MNYSKLNMKLKLINLVNSEIINKFKHLNSIKEKIKGLKRGSPEEALLAKEIKTVRSELKTTPFSEYSVSISSGRFFYEQSYFELPEPLSFKEVADTFIYDIKQYRQRNKSTQAETRSILGFQYSMTGNVFTSEGSILQLNNTTDPMRRISTAKTPHPKIKGKYVGIELELICNMSREALCRAFIAKNLAGYVYVKGDSSIQTELDSDKAHEVTVLCKQENAKYIMTKVCEVLNSEECKARVNNSCGFHLHLDMRNRDAYVAYNNLVKALPMLSGMVPAVRVKGDSARRYCQQNQTSNLRDYYPSGTFDQPTSASRYQAINPVCLQHLKTLEVRLHSGTTNVTKILMWVDICVKLVESNEIRDAITNGQDFSNVVCNDSKIVEYINKRMKLFSSAAGQSVDTKLDHVLDSMPMMGVG